MWVQSALSALQVFWTDLGNQPLPTEIVQRFKGKVIAITGESLVDWTLDHMGGSQQHVFGGAWFLGPFEKEWVRRVFEGTCFGVGCRSRLQGLSLSS